MPNTLLVDLPTMPNTLLVGLPIMPNTLLVRLPTAPYTLVNSKLPITPSLLLIETAHHTVDATN